MKIAPREEENGHLKYDHDFESTSGSHFYAHNVQRVHRRGADNDRTVIGDILLLVDWGDLVKKWTRMKGLNRTWCNVLGNEAPVTVNHRGVEDALAPELEPRRLR